MSSTTRRIRTGLAALALLPAAGLAVAAGPEDDCADVGGGVLACTVTGWLSCGGAEGGKVHAVQQGGPVALDDTAPTASFTTGEGCGATEVAGEEGTAMENVYDLPISGRFRANVDSITVELHAIDLAPGRLTGGPLTLSVRAQVDGTSLAGTSPTVNRLMEPATAINEFLVDVQPVVSDSGASESFVFTLTDVHAAFPEFNSVGDGSDERRTIALTVGVDGRDYAGPWVWGATEIPASVTVNGEARGTLVSVLPAD